MLIKTVAACSGRFKVKERGGQAPSGRLTKVARASPISVGGGKRSLPVGVRVKLELLDERRFEGGKVYFRYRTKTQGDGSSADAGSPRV